MRLRSGLRRRRLAAHFVAFALVHVFPLGRVLVGLGALARTSMLGGPAIVLTALRDTVAFFLSWLRCHRPFRRLGDGCGGKAERQGAGDRSLNRGLMVHPDLLELLECKRGWLGTTLRVVGRAGETLPCRPTCARGSGLPA